ncbi:hypothetical protein IFR05_009865 [Cadophora sp. M221]|nr:hypothetical protein IFR05_009865 [Cadophora sp. M221]
METRANPNVMLLETILSPTPTPPTNNQRPVRTALPDSRQKPAHSKRPGLAEPTSKRMPAPPPKKQTVAAPADEQRHTSHSANSSPVIPLSEQTSAAQSRKPSLAVSASEEMPAPPAGEQMRTSHSNTPNPAIPFSRKTSATQSRKQSLAISESEENLAQQSKNPNLARPISDQVSTSTSTRVSSNFVVQSPRAKLATSESQGPPEIWAHGFKIYFSKDDLAKLAAETDPMIKVTAITFASMNNIRLTADTGIAEPHPPLSRRSKYADPIPLPTDQINVNSSELSLPRSSMRIFAPGTENGAVQSSLSALALSNGGSWNPEATYLESYSPNKFQSWTRDIIEADAPTQVTKQAPKSGRPPKGNGTSKASNIRQTSNHYSQDSDRMSPTSLNPPNGTAKLTQPAVGENPQNVRKRKNMTSTEGDEHYTPKKRVQPPRDGNTTHSNGSWHRYHMRVETDLKLAKRGLPPEDN